VAKVVKKESKWRIAAAIVGGYALIAFLIVLSEWIFGFAAPQIRTAREMPSYYFAVTGVTDSIYAFIGGYVCAKIARTAHRPATIGLMALGEAIALYSTVLTWYTAPHTYSLALLILYPPLVWAGSWLRVRRAPVKPILVRAYGR